MAAKVKFVSKNGYRFGIHSVKVSKSADAKLCDIVVAAPETIEQAIDYIGRGLLKDDDFCKDAQHGLAIRLQAEARSSVKMNGTRVPQSLKNVYFSRLTEDDRLALITGEDAYNRLEAYVTSCYEQDKKNNNGLKQLSFPSVDEQIDKMIEKIQK